MDSLIWGAQVNVMENLLLITFIFSLVVLVKILILFKIRRFKGWIGELAIKIFSRVYLEKSVYTGIHDITLPTIDGTTQIDHVFVSKYGIFVVESKMMKGWIYGSRYQAKWTQKFSRCSYKFQNPVRQNYKHVQTIKELLSLPCDVIKSVVVFTGLSTFKSNMPNEVTQGKNCFLYIKSFKTELLSEAEVKVAIDKIQCSRLKKSFRTNREHVKHLKDKFD